MRTIFDGQSEEEEYNETGSLYRHAAKYVLRHQVTWLDLERKHKSVVELCHKTGFGYTVFMDIACSLADAGMRYTDVVDIMRRSIEYTWERAQKDKTVTGDNCGFAQHRNTWYGIGEGDMVRTIIESEPVVGEVKCAGVNGLAVLDENDQLHLCADVAGMQLVDNSAKLLFFKLRDVKRATVLNGLR